MSKLEWCNGVSATIGRECVALVWMGKAFPSNVSPQSAVRSPTPHFTRATVPPTPTVVLLLPTREVAMAAGTSVASWAASSRHGHSEAMLIDDPTLELQLTNLLGVDESGSRSRAPVCTSNKTWEIRGDRQVQ